MGSDKGLAQKQREACGRRQWETGEEESRGLGECILEKQEQRNRGNERWPFLPFIQQTFTWPSMSNPGYVDRAVCRTHIIRALRKPLGCCVLSGVGQIPNKQAYRNPLRVLGIWLGRTQSSLEMGKSKRGWLEEDRYQIYISRGWETVGHLNRDIHQQGTNAAGVEVGAGVSIRAFCLDAAEEVMQTNGIFWEEDPATDQILTLIKWLY